MCLAHPGTDCLFRLSDPHISVLIDFCSVLGQRGACSWFEQGDRLCKWSDEPLLAAFWAIPEQHSYQLWMSAPQWPCGFPSLPLFYPPHCTVYVPSDMKETHGWWQNLSQVWKCFLASIKLTGEFNSPACALPFFCTVWEVGMLLSPETVA